MKHEFLYIPKIKHHCFTIGLTDTHKRYKSEDVVFLVAYGVGGEPLCRGRGPADPQGPGSVLSVSLTTSRTVTAATTPACSVALCYAGVVSCYARVCHVMLLLYHVVLVLYYVVLWL